jgi:pimeloyl-ACP methyl ester carboxylesterase
VKRRGRLLLAFLLVLALGYAAIVALAFLNQERLIFPAYLVVPVRELPPGASRLSVDAPDGIRLEGVHIPPEGGGRSDTLVLAFAGNASNAQGVAELIHEIYPGRDVVAFFYRGYAPSGGMAGAEALMADAPLIHDLVAERFRPRRIVAVGISLGSGVASALAARRPLAGLILVTPFDSLSATARQLHPWLPVSLLLRHDMRSADALRDSTIPVALVAAERDRLVRPERTEALRRGVANLVHDTTLAGAQHNDIFLHPGFEIAMRQALERVESATGSEPSSPLVL